MDLVGAATTFTRTSQSYKQAIYRQDHLQDTVDCINLHPIEEENELGKYFSTLPEEHAFDPMDLAERGFARVHIVLPRPSF